MLLSKKRSLFVSKILDKNRTSAIHMRSEKVRSSICRSLDLSTKFCVTGNWLVGIVIVFLDTNMTRRGNTEKRKEEPLKRKHG